MKTGKSTKMAETEKEIVQATQKMDELVNRQKGVSEFEPTTKDGQAAREQKIGELAGEIANYRNHLTELRSRFEIETVEYLGSEESGEVSPAPMRMAS